MGAVTQDRKTYLKSSVPFLKHSYASIFYNVEMYVQNRAEDLEATLGNLGVRCTTLWMGSIGNAE